MKRIARFGLVVGALAVAFATLIGARAFAEHEWGGGFERHFQKKLEGALDAAKASPEQRTAINNAVEHVTSTMHDLHKARGPEMERVLSLFEADRLDPKAIAAERAAREADMQKMGDAIVQAISDAHDALTSPQRKAVAEYIRSEHASHAKHELAGKLMKGMIATRIESALDEIKATDAQRATVHAAAERVHAAFEADHASRGADLEKALALFTADKIDMKAVAALRAEHLAAAHRIGDAIVQAVTDVHGALDAGQRKAVVDLARAHHAAHAGHGMNRLATPQASPQE